MTGCGAGGSPWYAEVMTPSPHPTPTTPPLPKGDAPLDRHARRWCWFSAAIVAVLFLGASGWVLMLRGSDDAGRIAFGAALGVGPALMTGWYLMWLFLVAAGRVK